MANIIIKLEALNVYLENADRLRFFILLFKNANLVIWEVTTYEIVII